MDMSMILGFTLAGSIMLLSGNKQQEKDSKQPGNASEFVVSVDGNGISISPSTQHLSTQKKS